MTETFFQQYLATPRGARCDTTRLTSGQMLELIDHDCKIHDLLLKAIVDDDAASVATYWQLAWHNCMCGDYTPTYNCPLLLAARQGKWATLAYLLLHGGYSSRHCGCYLAIANECETQKVVDAELLRAMKLLSDRPCYFLNAWDYTFAQILVAALQKDIGIKENREFLGYVMERCKTAFPYGRDQRPLSFMIHLLCQLTAGLRTFHLDAVALPRLCYQIPLWDRVYGAHSLLLKADNVDHPLAVATCLFHCFLVDCCIVLYKIGLVITEPIVQAIVEFTEWPKYMLPLQRGLAHYDSFYALVPRVRQSCRAITVARKVSCQLP